MNKAHLILYDRCPDKDWDNFDAAIHFVWDEFTSEGKIVSVAELVETKAEYYRAAFLNWVDEFATTRIDNKTVYEYLMLKDGLPFWWNTSLGQRFNIFEDSTINDAIKSMAFVDYLKENNIAPITLELNTNKGCLNAFFSQWTAENNIPLKVRGETENCYKHKSPTVYLLFLFRFVLYRLVLPKTNRVKEVEIAFFDIFTHLKQGPKFESNYWTKLVDLLREKKINVQWNHLYYRTAKRFSFLKAVKQNQEFNKHEISGSQHAIIEQTYGLVSFIKTFWRYNFIKRKGRKLLPKLYNAFLHKGKSINLSPFFYNHFKESLCGQEGLKNCFFSVLLENAVNQIPVKSKGVYLQEFQPWEIALVHYWKKNKRNTLIGMPHSTHRYWDLRYFFGEKSFQYFTGDIFPDRIAVNGDYSFDRCIENGYPKSILTKVEALRYLHHPKVPHTKKEKEKSILNLLICCDYQLQTSKRLFALVKEAIQNVDFKAKVQVRMHPSYPIPHEILNHYNYEINSDELISAFKKADWVITSNLSAIAVDGYYQGCNVAQLSDGLYFNLSPLRGVIDELLFNSSEELMNKLKRSKKSNLDGDYFTIDQFLKQWELILND